LTHELQLSQIQLGGIFYQENKMPETVEAMLAALGPLPLEPTDEDIVARRKSLEHISSCIRRLSDRIGAEAKYLKSLCKHTAKYSSNWCGRDPGSGGCSNCGGSW